MLAEFFNSPSTNSFILIYVAIVDAKDIPIGDMKIVGTRLDHNLTHESSLSTWHYEGYSAPGKVIRGDTNQLDFKRSEIVDRLSIENTCSGFCFQMGFSVNRFPEGIVELYSRTTVMTAPDDCRDQHRLRA